VTAATPSDARTAGRGAGRAARPAMGAAPILVPLDGSDKDVRALAVALAAADLTGGMIELVRVVPSPGEGGSREVRTAAEQDLAAVAPSLAAAGASATWAVLEADDVPAALLAYADARGAGLLVVGTRAAGAVARLRDGSVADRLVREGTRPVLLAPPLTDHVAGAEIRLRRVLVPHDGSAHALGALDALLRLARPGRLELVLVEVVPPSDHLPAGVAAVPAPPHSPHRAPAEARLAAAAGLAAARGVAAETHVAESPYPAEAISAGVRDHLVDVIALGTRGRGGLTRLLLGSVATGVVGRSEVPVLLMPAGD